MFKILFLFLVPLANANEFILKETGQRFELRIKKTEMFYMSETTQKTIPVKECNRAMIQGLNAEYLSLIPKDPPKEGLNYFVDKTPFKVDIKSPAAKKILTTDIQMKHFFLLEADKCK